MSTFLDSVTINGQEAFEVKRKKIKLSSDYEDEDEFLLEMRERYDNGVGFDQHNIDAGQDDARFAIGNQWDSQVEDMRRQKNKPVLTFNRVMAFVGQVLGERLVNETEIRVYPDKGGTKEAASIIEGIIRSIFKNSDGDLARNEAQKYQVIGGRGVYALAVKYSGDDVFEQEIRIEQVADPYSAVFDPLSIDPTAGDAEWGFLSDDIPLDQFKKRWPKAAPVDFATSQLWNKRGYWCQADTVRIVSYWAMVTEGTKVLAMTQDGITRDVTAWMEEEYLIGRPYEMVPPVASKPDGSLYVREVPNRFARLYICSGNQILDGPYDYPISSIPIYRVSGWEVNDGERLQRWGLVRFIKDAQRLYNFFRSVQAEQLVSAPRNKWLVTQAAIAGYENKWRASPTNDDPFLQYNGDEPPPVPIPPPPADQALMEQAITSAQDMKDISNIHEAALGMPSNEVSKVAIQQRQMVSNIGTFIYQDRLRMADERCAKNIMELVPHIYDTPRIVRIVGADSKTTMQVINSGELDNVTIGKYDVTVSVGPTTITKRQQAAEQMMAFVNAMPQVAPGVMDLVAEAQDWPKSDEFAKRFRMMLPPGTIPEDEMTPEMKAAQAQQAQMAQMAAQVESAQMEAKTAKTIAEAQLAEARAKLSEAQAIKAMADSEARLKDVNSKIDDREIKNTLSAFDQHNTLAREDREDAKESDEETSKTGNDE